MKLIKTASGKQLKISKEEWQSIGKKAGWTKEANSNLESIDVIISVNYFDSKSDEWKTMDDINATLTYDPIEKKVDEIDVGEISFQNGPYETFFIRGGETFYPDRKIEGAFATKYTPFGKYYNNYVDFDEEEYINMRMEQEEENRPGDGGDGGDGGGELG